jgi:hypothetical protein
MYQCWKSEGWFINASDTLACQTIKDRGIAMIPLPRWGGTMDWWRNKKKNKNHVIQQMSRNVWTSLTVWEIFRSVHDLIE